MKRKSFYLFAAIATTFCLSSCSNDESSEKMESPAELKIVATMAPSLEVSTRASYNLQGTALNDPTNVGVYVWYETYKDKKTSSPVYNGFENVKIASYTGLGPYTLAPSKVLAFPTDNHDVDVYLYAPYKASPTQTNMCMEHTVALDQSLTAGYEDSDFLYGKATASYSTTKTASVNMYHAMSKIIFKVVNSGVDPSLMTDITLKNVLTTTTINMPVAITSPLTCGSGSTTYNVDVASNKNNIKVWGTSGTGAVSASDAVTNGVAVIVPPQTTGADAELSVSVNDGSTTLSATAAFSSITLGPGKVYTYNLNLKGTGVIVSLVSITDWDDSDSPTGTAADLDFDTWS